MNIKNANLFTMFTIISLVIAGVRNIEWEHFNGNKFLCNFFIFFFFLFIKNWHVEKVVKSILDWNALFAIVSNKSAKIEWSEALITVQTWAQNLITSLECIKGFNIELYEFWHEIHFKMNENEAPYSHLNCKMYIEIRSCIKPQPAFNISWNACELQP